MAISQDIPHQANKARKHSSNTASKAIQVRSTGKRWLRRPSRAGSKVAMASRNGGANASGIRASSDRFGSGGRANRRGAGARPRGDRVCLEAGRECNPVLGGTCIRRETLREDEILESGVT
jgi:hypothetical protein